MTRKPASIPSIFPPFPNFPQIRNLMNEGMMSLYTSTNDSLYIMVPGSSSHVYYLPIYWYEEEMDEICTALDQHGVASWSGKVYFK